MKNIHMIKQIVQPMARGQITIPIKIRKRLGINENSWLWVKLKKNKIVIEPVAEEIGSETQSFLKDASQDENVYWAQRDTDNLDRVDEKSKERVKKLNK